MADLSFIEDSVAFPEKEEDEEEEEEGVEWGYEEGNPRRVGLAGVPGQRVRLRAARVPRSAGLRTPLISRAPSASASPLSHVGGCRFPSPRPVSGRKALQGRRAGPLPAPALGSLAFLPGSSWHLPPSGGRALKLWR